MKRESIDIIPIGIVGISSPNPAMLSNVTKLLQKYYKIVTNRLYKTKHRRTNKVQRYNILSQENTIQKCYFV